MPARHHRSHTLLAVRTHLAGRRDQMLLRLACGVAPRPPLPANVPPLARAYTLVMVDRVQDGELQASSELSSSSRSFNWGGDMTEMDPTFGHLPTFGGLPTGMAHPPPLRRALWFEGYLRERPVSDPVEMRRHDGAPLRQPRGPASTHSPRASLPAARMHNPRSLAHDCARLSAAVSLPPSHTSRRIDDDTQRLSREWTRLWAVCVVITLAINGADSMLPRGCLVHDFQALFLGSWV